jgi:hypothetical protein
VISAIGFDAADCRSSVWLKRRFLPASSKDYLSFIPYQITEIKEDLDSIPWMPRHEHRGIDPLTSGTGAAAEISIDEATSREQALSLLRRLE